MALIISGFSNPQICDMHYFANELLLEKKEKTVLFGNKLQKINGGLILYVLQLFHYDIKNNFNQCK